MGLRSLILCFAALGLSAFSLAKESGSDELRTFVGGACWNCIDAPCSGCSLPVGCGQEGNFCRKVVRNGSSICEANGTTFKECNHFTTTDWCISEYVDAYVQGQPCYCTDLVRNCSQASLCQASGTCEH